jgi:hypothetical protein
MAVCTSWLAPVSIACSTLSESRTPAAQDPMPVFMSARKPFRSVARCDREGWMAIPVSTAPSTTANRPTISQRGILRVGHRTWRMGT